MSVWQQVENEPAALFGAEGELVTVSVAVDAHFLEDVLEVLADLSFPVNPEIYHEAALVSVYDDGRREVAPTTLVEFPAYSNRVDEVRKTLGQSGFPLDSVRVSSMLDELQSHVHMEAAPAGASYRNRLLVKHAHAAAAA